MAKNIVLRTKLEGGRKTKRGLKSVDSGLRSLGKSALMAGGAFFAVSGIIRGFKSVIKLAGIQEQAEKKLATALGHTSQALLNQASAFQKVSKFGDETLIEMMALASNMGITEDQIASTTEMAIGLAEAFNLDLNMAMKAAAAAVQGDTMMLSRYIPAIKGVKDETEKLAIVQRGAAAGFEQSKANTETMTGSLGQLEMAIGDAAESIGELLGPVIINIAGFLKTAAEAASSFFKSFAPVDLDQIISQMKELKQEAAFIAELEKFKVVSELNKLRIELQGLGEEQTTLEKISQKLSEENTLLETQAKNMADSILEENMMNAGLQKGLMNKTAARIEELANLSKLIIRYKQLTEQYGLLKQGIEATPDPPGTDPDALAALDEFTLKQLKLFEAQELEKKQINDFIELYPAKAEALGMITKEQVKQVSLVDEHILALERMAMISAGMIDDNDAMAISFESVASASGTSLRQMSSLFSAVSDDNKDLQIKAMRLAQFAAIADTAAGVMKAFKQGGTLGFITGAGILAAGVAQVAVIESAIGDAQAAQFGFDGVVNKPTLFMTGEGGRAEHVSVTPLQSPNISGPAGQPITINISAPLVDETVIDTIIPAIQKAQRLNLA